MMSGFKTSVIELLEEAKRVAQRLVRLYGAHGNRDTILRTYQNCTAVLQCELAIEQGLTTRKTYERLMRAEV